MRLPTRLRHIPAARIGTLTSFTVTLLALCLDASCAAEQFNLFRHTRKVLSTSRTLLVVEISRPKLQDWTLTNGWKTMAYWHCCYHRFRNFARICTMALIRKNHSFIWVICKIQILEHWLQDWIVRQWLPQNWTRVHYSRPYRIQSNFGVHNLHPIQFTSSRC